MAVVPLKNSSIQAAGVTPLDMWPIVGDAADIRAIVEDQAATIQAQDDLISAYQANLKSAQNPPPGTAATGQGTTSGASTTLTVASVSGTIVKGASISGPGIPTNPAPTILGQISGTTGGNGTYLMSTALTLSSATALTLTPPSVTGTWPVASDSPTLMLIQQAQTAILRLQSALLQNYQNLLNVSGTPAPPTGP